MAKFNIGLFLLALPAFLVQGESKLRGTPPEDIQRELASHGYNEKLGMCRGAACGLWGDPHMITCDGLGFDCQGLGTFNLMENHMYKIQAQFVDVGAHEHGLIKGWGLTEGASLTNDIAVEFKQEVFGGEDVPVFQLGFGELDLHDKDYVHPSERGCTEYSYFNPTDMPGQRRSVEPTLESCRGRCDRTEGCTKFSWWADGGCHLNNDAQHPRPSPLNWPRSLSGNVDECGLGMPPEDELELTDPEETRFHGRIGAQCPLLFHKDGDLQDIHKVSFNGFLYGDANAAVKIQLINNYLVVIEYKLASGDYATIMLVAKGSGPEELWSCHWDFYVCLPASQQRDFMDHSIGLLGTPDGNTHNDWMTATGEEIPIQNYENNWHKTLIKYCYENHCTSQADNLITPHAGQTFEDVKCQEVEYKDFSVNSTSCVITGTQIVEACKDMPPLLVHACEVDCCMGGCGQIEETREEIDEVVEYSDEGEDILYEVERPPPASCEDEKLENTAETACPSSDEVVKLLSGGDSPPGDVFFGIVMDSGGDEVGRTVKFKVNNPFDEAADVYVKYGKSVFGHSFMDPKCDGFTDQPAGCNDRAAEIEVACHDYDHIGPFALVQVYFASTAINGSKDIDACCNAPDYTDMGVVMYSFEVQCACPANNGVANPE